MAHPLRERIACGEVCRHLRTKSMYLPGSASPTPGVDELESTAHFWCIRSGWALGPDLSPASPDGCAAGGGRGCFEPDVSA